MSITRIYINARSCLYTHTYTDVYRWTGTGSLGQRRRGELDLFYFPS